MAATKHFFKCLIFGCGWPLEANLPHACLLRLWDLSTGTSGLGLGGGGGAWLLLASSYCCDRWGVFEKPTPLKVLEGLAAAIVRCMEPWRPRQPPKVVVCCFETH